MKLFFEYNWRVRTEWLSWCETLTEAELLTARVGGVGGIAKTLFHIIDVEWSWIRRIQGKVDEEQRFESDSCLAQLYQLN